MSDTQTDGHPNLHPRHPGIGASTSLIELESDEPEVGGFLVFLPSGNTKQVVWRTARPITPTLDAAKDYTSKVVEDLERKHGIGCVDIQRTNWTSVCAAVQRVIMDFNSKLSAAINAKMARDFMSQGGKRWRH